MRNLILSTALVCATVSASLAQSNQVQNAFNYLKNKEYDKAKIAADLASLRSLRRLGGNRSRRCRGAIAGVDAVGPRRARRPEHARQRSRQRDREGVRGKFGRGDG